MKTPSNWLALASLILITVFGTAPAEAQQRGGGRGDFDPEQFRERMMERMREQFEVKNDDEWKLIQGRIEKVMEARREAAMGPRFGGFGGRRGGPGGPGGPGGDEGRGGERRRGFGPEPSPEIEALEKALEANASNDEIKSKLAGVRSSQKAKQAALDKAQDDLRKVLTVRQEARALMMGLID